MRIAQFIASKLPVDTNEFRQSFVDGRTSSLIDVSIDLIGITRLHY